jgi:hypothetical protein
MSRRYILRVELTEALVQTVLNLRYDEAQVYFGISRKAPNTNWMNWMDLQHQVALRIQVP